MKYFAVAVIFGLFALSQAMPVEESEQKRFFGINIVGIAVNAAKTACNVIENQPGVDQLITKACVCLRAVDNIGIFGDEKEVQQKRFLDLNGLIGTVQHVINGVCANAPPQFAELCQCIQF